MKVSQSLIKEVLKPDHCPKQIMYSFIEGRELIEPSENMLLGRYFESELLGSCRGGEKQEPRFLKGGEIAKPYADTLELVEFARTTLQNIGLDLSLGHSQVDEKSESLSGALDHVNFCIENPKYLANYDVKWTATKEDDIWNGWGSPENKADAEIQAVHYTLVTYEIYGEWRPFYFLVFGKDKWVKILRFRISEEAIDRHRERIFYTSQKIREYAENGYKGNGSFNKCISCPFFDICPDKATVAEIESIHI